MCLLHDARQLANFILSIPDFTISVEPLSSYDHMGATITDTILQAGLNYRTVVEPRVKGVLNRYPDTRTTSDFLAIISTDGVSYVLNWYHPEKLRRVQQLTSFLVYSNIETENNLRHWIIHPENCRSLLNIRGIGPKSIDYMKNLIGIPTIAVDRHVRNFVSGAGIQRKDYYEIRSVVEFAADLINVPRSSLDRAIWSYGANSEKLLPSSKLLTGIDTAQ